MRYATIKNTLEDGTIEEIKVPLGKATKKKTTKKVVKKSSEEETNEDDNKKKEESEVQPAKTNKASVGIRRAKS